MVDLVHAGSRVDESSASSPSRWRRIRRDGSEDAAEDSGRAAGHPPRGRADHPVNGDLAEVVYALGLGDQVVATDISATYPPAAASDAEDRLPADARRGDDPGATSRPSFSPTTWPDHQRCSISSPPPVCAWSRSTATGRVERVAEKIRAVAAALGVPERGGRAGRAARGGARCGRGARRGSAVATSGRPKVLALYLRGENVQLVFGKGSGIDAVIDAAGGTDLGTEMGVVDNAELSIESIVAAAPDVLLVTTTGLESVGGVDGLLAMPGHRPDTRQPRDGRVVAFEDQYLYGLGPRIGQLVDELVDAFHPHPDMQRTPPCASWPPLSSSPRSSSPHVAVTTTTPAPPPASRVTQRRHRTRRHRHRTTTTAAETTDDRTTAPETTAPAPRRPLPRAHRRRRQTRRAAYVPGADPEADAVALAWTTAFDSNIDFATKAPFIADAEALRPTIDAYTPAGAAVGGITLGADDDRDHGRHGGDHLRRRRSPARPPTRTRTARRNASTGPGSSAATSSAGSWLWQGTPARRMSGARRPSSGARAVGGRSSTVGPPVRRAPGLLRRARARRPGERRRRCQVDPAQHRDRRPVRLRPDATTTT